MRNNPTLETARETENAAQYLPTTLVLLAFPHWLEEQVAAVLGHHTRIVNVPDVVGAAVQMQKAHNACLMFLVPQASGFQAIADHQRLIHWHPDVPAVAVFDQTLSSCASLLELGRRGVREVVAQQELLIPSVVRSCLHRCQMLTVSNHLWKLCAELVPASLAPLLQAALQLAHSPVTVSMLADKLATPESTLGVRCANASIPTPSWILSWARAATAGYFVERLKCSLVQTAAILQYRDSASLEKSWIRLRDRHSVSLAPSVSESLELLKTTLKFPAVLERI